MLDIFFVIITLLASFALIVKGANYLIDGAADIARMLRVSPLLVGLTIVAFGTSLPEFVVSIFAAINGSGDIAVGNIVGSNIVNIGLILGISAMVTPLAIRSKTLAYEFPFLIVSAFVLLIMANNLYVFGSNTYSLDRIDGVGLLIIFGLFTWYIFKTAQKERKAVRAEFKEKYQHQHPLWKNGLFLVGGLAGLVIGGRLFISAATKLAITAGISETFIGLIIAALGTSLPELASSAVAAWKKQGDIALGNIVGSNIFNIVFVLGLSSVIKPMPISQSLLQIDIVVMVIISLLLLFFATQNHKLTRTEGIILVLSYCAYLAYQLYITF